MHPIKWLFSPVQPKSMTSAPGQTPKHGLRTISGDGSLHGGSGTPGGSETLEVVPRQWKVIQTVCEHYSCRECETITQPPSPFHVTPRGFAGPSLLAMILFEKFGP
jgi:hypothetical protein